MNKQEMLNWLEALLGDFPERGSGEDLYAYFVEVTKDMVNSGNAGERIAFIDALREWLRTGTEPRTMLAVELAAAHKLIELKEEVEKLLASVKEGRVLWPYYARFIEQALGKIR